MIIKLRAKTIGHQLVSKWSTELPLAAQSRLLLMVRTTVREVRLWLFVDLCHTCHLIRGHSRILLKVFRDISVCRVKSESVWGVLFALWGGLKLALATQKWQNLHCSQELTLPAEQSNYSGYITPVWDSVCERIWWGLTDGIVFRSVWQSNTGKHVHEINQILTICNVYFLGLAVIIQKGWMSKSHTVLSSHCLRNTKK